jgi:Flp pilus assembly protein TadG
MNTRSDRGQATVLTLVFLVVLLGMAALVLDLGSWYRSDRATQSAADAAALAGAQALPSDPGGASTLALQYSNKNGGGLAGGDISISSGLAPNDTIKVKLTRSASGVFTKLFGVHSVTVGAHATARASLMDQARYVAPIGVNVLNPKLKGNATCPCFGIGNPTTLPLGKTGAPGAFDLLNIDSSHGGTGPSILADWILHGYDGYLSLGDYFSDAGAKWNSNEVQAALERSQCQVPRRRVGGLPPDRLPRPRLFRGHQRLVHRGHLGRHHEHVRWRRWSAQPRRQGRLPHRLTHDPRTRSNGISS